MQEVLWRYGQWSLEQGMGRQVTSMSFSVWIYMAFDPWSVGLQFTAGWGWKDSGVCAIFSIRQSCSTVPSLCTSSLWTWLALETLLTLNLSDPILWSVLKVDWWSLHLGWPGSWNVFITNNLDENKRNWVWSVYKSHPPGRKKSSPWPQTWPHDSSL